MFDLIGLILKSQIGTFSKSTWKSIYGVAAGVALMLFITSTLDSFIINLEDYMLNFLPEIRFQRYKNTFLTSLKVDDAQGIKDLIGDDKSVLSSGSAFIERDFFQIATDTTHINKNCLLFSGLIPDKQDKSNNDYLLNIKSYLQINEPLANILAETSNKVIISRRLQLKLFGNSSAIGKQLKLGRLKTEPSKLTTVFIAGIYNNNSVNAIFLPNLIASSITGNNKQLLANTYVVRLKDKYYSKNWIEKLGNDNINLRNYIENKRNEIVDKNSLAYKKLDSQYEKAKTNVEFLASFQQVKSWMEESPKNLDYLKITRKIMLVVFTSIIFLTGLSIKFLFDTIVIDKKRQIAILKTLGYSDLSILNSFIMAGVFIGCMGVFIGIAFGFFLNWSIGLIEQQYFEQSFSFQYVSILPSLLFTGKVALYVMVVCAVSALPSALLVMKTSPIDGIRRDN